MKRPYIDVDDTIKEERLRQYGVPKDIPFGGEWRCSDMYQSFHPLGSTWREVQRMKMNMETNLNLKNNWIWFTNLFRRD